MSVSHEAVESSNVKTFPSLDFDKTFLRIVQSSGDESVLQWADVKEIFAFKDDAFAYDIICIGFRTDDEGSYFKIDEECGCYGELLDFLPTVFPSLRAKWFAEVAFPAFATCLVSLWGEKRMEQIWIKQIGRTDAPGH